MARTGGPAPDWTDKYITLIENGATIENAGRLAGGQAPRTVSYWLKRGKDEADRLEQNPHTKVRKTAQTYYELYVRHRRALAQFEQNLVNKIVNSENYPPHTYKASLEVLKLRFPARWGTKPNQDDTARNVILNVFQNLADQPTPEHEEVWETPE